MSKKKMVWDWDLVGNVNGYDGLANDVSLD